MFVARGGHSITLVAEDEADAYTYLIHYDADAGEDARPGALAPTSPRHRKTPRSRCFMVPSGLGQVSHETTLLSHAGPDPTSETCFGQVCSVLTANAREVACTPGGVKAAPDPSKRRRRANFDDAWGAC